MFSRVQIVKDGKKRKLIINGCKLEDAGKITVKSNADESSADLGVKCESAPALATPPLSVSSSSSKSTPRDTSCEKGNAREQRGLEIDMSEEDTMDKEKSETVFLWIVSTSLWEPSFFKAVNVGVLYCRD